MIRVTPTRIELLVQLSGIVARGLAAGLSTTITDEQITTIATSSASAAAAIIGDLQADPQILPLRAEQAAVIFAALQSGNWQITSPEITSTASTSVSCVAAIPPALPGSPYADVLDMQISAAVQVFAGLALGLSSITGEQITALATLSATAVAAIRSAN